MEKKDSNIQMRKLFGCCRQWSIGHALKRLKPIRRVSVLCWTAFSKKTSACLCKRTKIFSSAPEDCFSLTALIPLDQSRDYLFKPDLCPEPQLAPRF